MSLPPEEMTDFQQDWCKAKTSSLRTCDLYSAIAACLFSLPAQLASHLFLWISTYYLITYLVVSLPQMYIHSSELDFTPISP